MMLVELTGRGQHDERTKSADAALARHLDMPVETDALLAFSRIV